MQPSLWDAIAAVERSHWWFLGRREIVAQVLQRRIAAGSRVVDVGCGTGFVLERLAGQFDVTGLEPDPSVRARAHASIASRILPGATNDLSAVQGMRFDAVLLLDVLEHLDDDDAALRGLHPVLAPGGLLLVMVPANPRLWSTHDELNEHRRRYTAGGLRRILADGGYSVEHLGFVNSRLYPLARLHRTLSRNTNGALRIPPSPLNRIFMELFAREAKQGLPRFRRGLSLLALATRK